MENISTNIGYEIAKEKLGSYYSHNTDFIGDHEITVTITLSEYRSLLTASAKAERDQMQREKWDAESKVKELEKQLNAIKELMPCVKPSEEVDE